MNDSFTADVRHRLQALLDQFERDARPGPFDYKWVHHHDGGQHPFHVVFGCMIHGNEFGSLPAAVRLVEQLNHGNLAFGGRVSVFIGNPEAALENRRYLEADLNRVFLNTGHARHEDKRAQEIMPVLNAADVLLDFHQTIEETAKPFYVFPWQELGWLWARATRGTDLWVTRDPAVGFSQGSKCTDEFVADRGRPGMTFELSQKGFCDEADALCWNAMLNTLSIAEAHAKGEGMRDLAQRKPELTFLTTTFAEPFDDPEKCLRPGLANFQPVNQGHALHAPGTPELRAPHDGFVLFPKYPERQNGRAKTPRPSELYRLIGPLDSHPIERWGSS